MPSDVPSKRQSGEYKRECDCGKVTSRSARHCPRCGTSLRDTDEPRCPGCGSEPADVSWQTATGQHVCPKDTVECMVVSWKERDAHE